jgi:NAD(P)-dependent dehydrogenase (short-subunit alcohol dehydrogenase family)
VFKKQFSEVEDACLAQAMVDTVCEPLIVLDKDLRDQGGSIILTGSNAGTTGAPAFTAYSASKAAVRNLARTWVEDRKGTGIRVNVLSPGAIATELATEAPGEAGLKAYGSMTGFQRMGDPAELGAAAAFLASSDSSFMTGSELAVDGGLAQI